MLHRSYEIVKCCKNCKSCFIFREPWEPDIYYCNSDNAKIPRCFRDPEEEEDDEYDPKKDEYEHWTAHRLVDCTGYCDNYKQDFKEMVPVLY